MRTYLKLLGWLAVAIGLGIGFSYLAFLKSDYGRTGMTRQERIEIQNDWAAASQESLFFNLTKQSLRHKGLMREEKRPEDISKNRMIVDVCATYSRFEAIMEFESKYREAMHATSSNHREPALSEANRDIFGFTSRNVYSRYTEAVDAYANALENAARNRVDTQCPQDSQPASPFELALRIDDVQRLYESERARIARYGVDLDDFELATRISPKHLRDLQIELGREYEEKLRARQDPAGPRILNSSPESFPQGTSSLSTYP